MSNAIPSTPLVYCDDVKFPLPAPYHAVLTVQDCQEIAELFVGTTRNPNHCISKGQYAKLTEQLAARNKMLEKRVRELDAELNNPASGQAERDKFERAFQLIYEAYAKPLDAFPNDSAAYVWTRKQITEAFSIMQELRAAMPR